MIIILILNILYKQAYITCTYGVGMVGYIMACHGLFFGLSAYFVSKLAKYIGRPRLMVVIYVLYVGMLTCYYLLPGERPLYVMFMVVCLHGIVEGPISIQLPGMHNILTKKVMHNFN